MFGNGDIYGSNGSVGNGALDDEGVDNAGHGELGGVPGFAGDFDDGVVAMIQLLRSKRVGLVKRRWLLLGWLLGRLAFPYGRVVLCSWAAYEDMTKSIKPISG